MSIEKSTAVDNRQKPTVSAEEWLFRQREPKHNEAPWVTLLDANKALAMAYKEGRQEVAKEIFAELEKIVPCGTCKGEHSCYCSIETQDESKHLPNCEIKDWCIDIESLKAKWVKEE